MNNLNNDIIRNIGHFLDYNSKINFSITSSYICIVLELIKKIYIRKYEDIILYSKIGKNINNIEISGFKDPHLWIPKFTKIVTINIYFNQTSTIDPGQNTITEYLSIVDQKKSLKRKININWNCFKQLKKILLDVYDINTPPPILLK